MGVTTRVGLSAISFCEAVLNLFQNVIVLIINCIIGTLRINQSFT